MSKVVLTASEKRKSWALAFCAAIIIAIVVSPMLDRRLPREVIVQPLVSPIAPGQDLRLLLSIYPNFYCPAEVEESIIDHATHVWPVDRRPGVGNASTDPSLTDATPFDRYVNISTVRLAALGPARYESDVAYFCSWWQRYVRPLRVHRVVHFVFKAP